MPELPEVETTRRGIAAVLEGNTITRLQVRNRHLRWPVTRGIEKKIAGQLIRSVTRRGKYLLIYLERGALIIHLGMSGRLRLQSKIIPPEKHDHIDLLFETGHLLRYTDPRRFGAFLWTAEDPLLHELLIRLGPEPLQAVFSGRYLYDQTRMRKAPIKSFIMDSHVVVGVGNIYANEALFAAGIHPLRQAGLLTPSESSILAGEIKKVLRKAIRAGGTTLRDFSSAEGYLGYFQQELRVYGREDEPCWVCQQRLQACRLSQRATVFCPSCQR